MADPLNILQRDPAEVAQRLLGCELVRTVEGQTLRVRIVETEAYHEQDAASHSYKGSTPRTAVMFGPPGRVYVYFTYGMHYCMNVVTGPKGEGSAVLIRAAEPIEGLDYMSLHRAGRPLGELTNGPAKLCQAMNIALTLNGHDLHDPPLQLLMRPPLDPANIVTTTRIGITKEIDRPWRFYIRHNTFVSRLA